MITRWGSRDRQASMATGPPNRPLCVDDPLRLRRGARRAANHCAVGEMGVVAEEARAAGRSTMCIIESAETVGT